MKKVRKINNKVKNITRNRQNKSNNISIERNQTTGFFPRRQKSNLQRFRDAESRIVIKTDTNTIRTIWKYGGLKGYFKKVKRSKLTTHGKKLRNRMVSFAN